MSQFVRKVSTDIKRAQGYREDASAAWALRAHIPSAVRNALDERQQRLYHAVYKEAVKKAPKDFSREERKQFAHHEAMVRARRTVHGVTHAGYAYLQKQSEDPRQAHKE